MSELSRDHTFAPFVAGKSVASSIEQRLAKVTFKTVTDPDTKLKSKKDSKCVSIPMVSRLGSEVIEAMKPHILAMYHDAQDGIIRELVEEGKTSVNDAQIDSAAVVAFLASPAASYVNGVNIAVDGGRTKSS